MVMLGTKWLASGGISSHCTDGISVSGLSYPSITSARREGCDRQWSAYVSDACNCACAQPGRLTHVQPLCTALDHAFAFCGELAEVGGEDRGRDDCARHCCGILWYKSCELSSRCCST